MQAGLAPVLPAGTCPRSWPGCLPSLRLVSLANPSACWLQSGSGGSGGKGCDGPGPVEHVFPCPQVTRRLSCLQEILQGRAVEHPAAELIGRSESSRSAADVEDRALGVVVRDQRDLKVCIVGAGRMPQVVPHSGCGGLVTDLGERGSAETAGTAAVAYPRDMPAVLAPPDQGTEQLAICL